MNRVDVRNVARQMRYFDAFLDKVTDLVLIGNIQLISIGKP